MLALPITNDQPGVAARIANKKLGVVVSPDQASPGNFVAAINRVLEDSTVRDNVQRAQEAIRRAGGLRLPQVFLKQHLGWNRGSIGASVDQTVGIVPPSMM